MNNIEINSLSKEEFVRIVTNLSKSHLKILNEFISFDNNGKRIWMNQTTIGRWNKNVRQTGHRKTNELCQVGVITKKYRHMNTCEYSLHPLFRDPEIREKLSGYFRSLIWFPMIYLFAFWRTDCIVDVTQNIIVNRFIYKPINSLSNVYRLTDSREAAKQKALRKYMTAVQKEYLREIGHLLNLTNNGRLQFVIFPEEALLYALEVLRKAHRTNQLAAKFNVFNFALSLCHDWCRDNQKVKAVGLVDELAREYKVDRNAPFIKPRSHASGKYEQSFKQPAFNRIPRKEVVPQWKQKGESKRPQTIWNPSQEPRRTRPMHEIRLEKAIKNGDEEFVKRLRAMDTPDYFQPSVFKAAYDFAKKAPDHIKEEWYIDSLSNPDKYSPPILKVIKEFKDMAMPEYESVQIPLPEIDLPDILALSAEALAKEEQEPDIYEENDVGPYRFEDLV